MEKISPSRGLTKETSERISKAAVKTSETRKSLFADGTLVGLSGKNRLWECSIRDGSGKKLIQQKISSLVPKYL